MLSRLTTATWDTVKLVHREEGEVMLKRAETEIKLDKEYLVASCPIEVPAETKGGKPRRLLMEAHFQVKDISSVVYYKESTILTT